VNKIVRVCSVIVGSSAIGESIHNLVSALILIIASLSGHMGFQWRGLWVWL